MSTIAHRLAQLEFTKPGMTMRLPITKTYLSLNLISRGRALLDFMNLHRLTVVQLGNFGPVTHGANQLSSLA